MAVTYHLTSGVAVLTLDDADRRNALSRKMVSELNQYHRQSLTDRARALILAGNGSAFCAGANIDDLRTGWMTAKGEDDDPVLFFRTLSEDPRPTIAAVHGIAAGGGLELALSCDLVVVGDSAKFVAPELGHGVIPPLGAALLPLVVGQKRALDLVLTRRIVGSDEALAIGLATHRAGTKDVVSDALAIASSIIGSVPPGALAIAKQHMRRHQNLDWNSILSVSSDVPAGEWQEGLASFLEKRKPDYERFWSAP